MRILRPLRIGGLEGCGTRAGQTLDVDVTAAALVLILGQDMGTAAGAVVNGAVHVGADAQREAGPTSPVAARRALERPRRRDAELFHFVVKRARWHAELSRCRDGAHPVPHRVDRPGDVVSGVLLITFPLRFRLDAVRGSYNKSLKLTLCRRKYLTFIEHTKYKFVLSRVASFFAAANFLVDTLRKKYFVFVTVINYGYEASFL